MALSKAVKVRVVLNKSRRKRWVNKEVLGYERTMKSWHEKFTPEATMYGHYSEEALACEPVSPHTRWKQKHADNLGMRYARLGERSDVSAT